MDELNEIKKENDSDYYTYLSELESIRDRKDKSTLRVCSVFPERFLSKDIAHPDEVKHLTIVLDFNQCGVGYTYYTWYTTGSDDLCSDIVNFKNLETLTATDLNLLEDLWIKFANNSKSLKEIYFSSSCEIDCGADSFYFDEKEKAVEAIFNISTLEKLTINNLFFPYFPPGPSNIKYLELCTNGEETKDALKTYDKYFEQIKSYSYNFCTHTNIKTLILDTLNISHYELKDLKLGNMTQLEELEIRNYWKIDELDIESILLLPNLKKFSCRIIETDLLMPALITTLKSDLKFSSLEEVTIYVLTRNNSKFNVNETNKYFSTMLKSNLNFKTFLFKVV